MNDVSIIDHFLNVFSTYIDSGFGLLRGFFCLLGCGSGLCLFLRSRIAVCFLTHIYASGSLCLFSGPSIAGVWFFWNIRLRFSAK